MALWRSDRAVRLAPVGAVGCAGLLPLLQVALAFSYPDNDVRTGLWSLAVTVVYLPLHLRHVWYAARGVRLPAGGWTFAAMAVVLLAAIRIPAPPCATSNPVPKPSPPSPSTSPRPAAGTDRGGHPHPSRPRTGAARNRRPPPLPCPHARTVQ
ncbi:hypothetical protein [Nonomuraea sp. NPDC003201]